VRDKHSPCRTRGNNARRGVVRAAVVPDCNIVLRPTIPNLEVVVLRNMPEAIVEHRVALVRAQLNDACRECLVHEKRSSARYRVRPHDWTSRQVIGQLSANQTATRQRTGSLEGPRPNWRRAHGAAECER
jgi:hypothetical protein